MNCYRITHIDEQRTRRRLNVVASSCRQALLEVEQAFGDAWFASAVRVEVQP